MTASSPSLQTPFPRTWISTEFLSIPAEATVQEGIQEIRLWTQKMGRELAYFYVCHSNRKIAGVLNVRDLLTSPPETKIRSIMRQPVFSLSDSASQSEVTHLFQSRGFLAVPIVNDSEELIGVVPIERVKDLLPAQFMKSLISGKIFTQSAGISQEEIEKSPVIQIVLKRLPWVSVTVTIGLICSYLLGILVGEIDRIIALVFLLPLILGFSGSIGTQTAAIVTRDLEDGNLNLRKLASAFLKSFGIGLALGFLSGLLIVLISLLWQKSPTLGLVLGCSIVAGSVVSAFLGIILSVTFRALNVRSQFASGLFLLLICDIVSVMLYVIIAMAFLGTSFELV